MNEVIRFKLGELLGVHRACDYLSEETLQAFVEHKLAPERLRRLEEHATSCADCTELLADAGLFEKLAAAGLRIPSERRAFREADAEARKRLRIGRGRSKPWSWTSWLMPAFGALALALTVVVLRPDPALFAEIGGMPLVAPPSVRGVTLAEVYDELGPVWSRDDMRSAVSILERGVNSNPGQQDLMFYLGVARARAGRAHDAVGILEELDALQAELPSEHTRWYLAVAYDRTGRRTEACDMLRSVVSIDGGRAAAAAAIVATGCDLQRRQRRGPETVSPAEATTGS